MRKPYIAAPGIKAVHIPFLGGGYFEATEDTSLPVELLEEGKFMRRQGYAYALPGEVEKRYVEIWWLQE